MKVLFTGSSSFSGFWFIDQLCKNGHEVTATFRGQPDGYPDDVRRDRVAMLREIGPACRAEFGCAFGSERFLELADQPYDVLCHHAFEMRDYRSPDYDFVAAVGGYTRGLRQTLRALAAGGCSKLVVTGTVFENDEGAGEEPREAFSPYGLAKGLAWQAARYLAGEQGFRLGKFVVPNPFGPLENPRFTAFLIRSWYAGETPQVKTPAYVRDNIHVSLLKRAYARFVERLGDGPGIDRHGPSGYAETQGEFARRFAREMRPRLGLPCEVELAHQTVFDEPRTRTNTDTVDAADLGWDEAAAWDEVADFYRARNEGGAA